MANLGNTGATRAADKSNDKSDDKPGKAAPVLDFTDRDAPPTAAELSQSSNPFQEKINELARTGKATSFVAPVDDADTLINQIRAAAANISKGSRVRREEIKGDSSRIRIHFWVDEKRDKKRSAK